MIKRLSLLCLCIVGCSHSTAPTVPPSNPKPALHAVYDTIPFGNVPIYRTKDTTISVTFVDSGLTITSVVLTNGVWSLVDSIAPLSPRTLKVHFLFTPTTMGDTSATLLVLSNNDTVVAARLLGSGDPLVAHKIGDSYTFLVATDSSKTYDFGTYTGSENHIETEVLTGIRISKNDTIYTFEPGIPPNMGSSDIWYSPDGDVHCVAGRLPFISKSSARSGTDTGLARNGEHFEFIGDTIIRVNNVDLSCLTALNEWKISQYVHGWDGKQVALLASYSPQIGYFGAATYFDSSYYPNNSTEGVHKKYSLLNYRLAP